MRKQRWASRLEKALFVTHNVFNDIEVRFFFLVCPFQEAKPAWEQCKDYPLEHVLLEGSTPQSGYPLEHILLEGSTPQSGYPRNKHI